MIDLNFIRKNPGDLDISLIRRGKGIISKIILRLDLKSRSLLYQLQYFQYQRNILSKNIIYLERNKTKLFKLIIVLIKKKIFYIQEKANIDNIKLKKILESLPNILLKDVPNGLLSTNYFKLYMWGVLPNISNPKQHFKIGTRLGYMDFLSASRMSGPRFVTLSGPLAKMERALSSFMLDIHVKHFGYTEVSAPLLVKSHALFATGQSLKFSQDLFKTTDGFWLIPTSEVSLTNLVREKTLEEYDLPLRFCSSTPCFRSEAGSSGRDTRGMIRQHQFYKVEMVSISHPDNSIDEHSRMVSAAELILQRLDLPYRVIVLSAGDTGMTSKKTCDLEVWLPGSGVYREISSCSIIGDYQARRMKSKFRSGIVNNQYVHTLNGSGVAIGRALVAIIENYQHCNGDILIPKLLRPYMNGIESISF